MCVDLSIIFPEIFESKLQTLNTLLCEVPKYNAIFLYNYSAFITNEKLTLI